MSAVERLRHWLCRKSFKAISPPIDYSIKRGDFVTCENWPYGPMEVIDVNWALRAIALRLSPAGGIVVWPAWGKVKVAP